MEAMAEAAAPSLTDLVQSLDQASLMAKQLPSTSNPAHLIQIYNSLHQTHLNLSAFLSSTSLSQSLPFPPPPLTKASLSSASTTAVNGDGDEPMQVAEDEHPEAEQCSKGPIEAVEKKMRDCFIKNKRVKRQLSESVAAMAEERRLHNHGFGATVEGFDPYDPRLRALDLIFQFHA